MSKRSLKSTKTLVIADIDVHVYNRRTSCDSLFACVDSYTKRSEEREKFSLIQTMIILAFLQMILKVDMHNKSWIMFNTNMIWSSNDL